MDMEVVEKLCENDALSKGRRSFQRIFANATAEQSSSIRYHLSRRAIYLHTRKEMRRTQLDEAMTLTTQTTELQENMRFLMLNLTLIPDAFEGKLALDRSSSTALFTPS